MEHHDQAIKFAQVLQDELEEIEKSRELRLENYKKPKEEINPIDPLEQAHNKRLMGITFSGGGIRSATFNLGVLQALAELGLLKHFDYLSTVSGGGYIGSWLTAQIHRLASESKNTPQEIKEVIKKIEDNLSPSDNSKNTPAISWLRSYSNYLTPRLGISGDLGAFVAIYIRNLILNLIIIVSALSSMLLVPRIVVLVAKEVQCNDWDGVVLSIGIIAFIISFCTIVFNLWNITSSEPKLINRLIITPLFIGSWSICQSKWLFSIHPFSYLDHIVDRNTFGVPLTLILISLIAIIVSGLLGKHLSDAHREWLARLNGLIAIFNLGWILFFAMALYSPIVIGFLGCWFQATLGVGWVVSTLSGLLAGKSDKTTGKGDSKNWGLELIAKIAPYVFIVGLLAVLSLGIHLLVVWWSDPSKHFFINGMCNTINSFSTIRNTYLEQVLGALYVNLLVFWGCFLAIAIIFSVAININEFSIHLPYRNRLVRAYLGASTKNRESNTNKFTGFNIKDDIELSEIISENSESIGYPGPYHIINGTLNLVADTSLAWQQRKASSFVFTPKYCGYSISNGGSKENKEAYRKNSKGYGGGVTLGTALAISGAAASPNMGSYSSPALGFLMTVFNVRLGWWLGNPSSSKSWEKPCPTLGLFYLVNELLELTNAEGEFVYLSDGGHFENLGVYELVRRRCRYIVASDAEADPNLAFGALGELIRKCYIDFGVEIEIDLEQIRRSSETNYSKWHCAVGRIHYETVDKDQTPGFLVYLKSSLLGNEEEDILNYAKLHPDFPHESTADQWFDEAQFESYRKLGYHVAKETFTSVKEVIPKEGNINLESLFVTLKLIW